jgi:hypothetical protein
MANKTIKEEANTTIENNNATFSFQETTFQIQRTSNANEINLKINEGEEEKIKFDSRQDFLNQMGEKLNKKVGKNRPNFRDDFIKIYNNLNLNESRTGQIPSKIYDPEHTKTITLKVGDSFKVGTPGFNEHTITLNYKKDEHNPSGALVFEIEFERQNEKGQIEIKDFAKGPRKTSINNEHTLELKDGSQVNFRITKINGDKYEIEISNDRSKVNVE